jgi:telomerase Cajal body protein 1
MDVDPQPDIEAETRPSWLAPWILRRSYPSVFHRRRVPWVNFLKGALWSPDGTSILTATDDKVLHTFVCPECMDPGAEFPSGFVEYMRPSKSFHAGECIYDYCWYPQMRSFDPSTCLYIVSTRDHPVRCYNASLHGIVATYRPHNHLDEVVSPIGIGFDAHGDKLLCGFDKCMRIFDFSRPGSECQTIYTRPKDGTGGRMDGISGMISCFASSIQHPNMFFAGSYSSEIGLFDLRTGQSSKILIGHQGGITHLEVTRCGRYLFSGARKDGTIYCWDIRNTVETMFECSRPVRTHQRMLFNTDFSGQYLIAGDCDGYAHLFDTASGGTPIAKIHVANGKIFGFIHMIEMGGSLIRAFWNDSRLSYL